MASSTNSSHSYFEYVDLISTASSTAYSNNKAWKFTNDLPIPQNLPQDAYVALTEISYTNAFYNVSPETCSIEVFDWDHKFDPNPERYGHNEPVYGKFLKLRIIGGMYQTPKSFIDMINQVLRNSAVAALKKINVFGFDETTKKVTYDFKGKRCTLFIKGSLLRLMGANLDSNLGVSDFVGIGSNKTADTFEHVDEAGVKTVRHVTKMDEGSPLNRWKTKGERGSMDHILQLTPHSSMVVYTDVIESQSCGDQFSDVLAFLPLYKAEFGSQMVHQVRSPYFLKVKKRYFTSITIVIKNLQDDFIYFKAGEVRIRLRFLPKSAIK